MSGLRIKCPTNGLPILEAANSPSQIQKALDPLFDSISKTGRTIRVECLDLAVPAQFKRYQSIWEAVGTGVVNVFDENKQWVEKKKNWLVLLKWVLMHSTDEYLSRNLSERLINTLLNGESNGGK